MMPLRFSAGRFFLVDSFFFIDPWALLFGALLILTLPLKWLVSAFLAALVHELWHIGCLIALGGEIFGLHIRIGGAVIDAHVPTKPRELVSIIAGPLGSFFLLFFLHSYPEIAICGCVQGIFNLLPIYPLDGGRLLRCLLEMYLPDKAVTVHQWIQRLILLFLAALAALVFRWCRFLQPLF